MFVETKDLSIPPHYRHCRLLSLSHTHTNSSDVELEWLEGGITGSGGSSWRQCVCEREASGITGSGGSSLQRFGYASQC
jgi:hypothetical protein